MANQLQHKQSKMEFIDVDADLDINIKVTTKVLGSDQVQIEYIYGDIKSEIIYDFSSGQEQLSLKELITGCNAEIYITKDGSISINKCDPNLSLDLTTEATITNDSTFRCKQLRLNAKYLQLQHNITTEQNCILNYSDQCHNQSNLMVGGTLFCNGIKAAVFNNTGAILVVGNIISSGKKLFNQGIILSDRQLSFSYRDYLINSKSGIIFSCEELHLRKYDIYNPIDVDELQPTSNLVNQGKIISSNKIVLLNNNGIISNEQSGLLKAKEMNLVGNQLINAGNLQAKQQLIVALSANDGYWYNTETGVVNARYLDCSLEQLINSGNIYAQQEIVSLLRILKNKSPGKIVGEAKIRLSVLEKIINDCIIKAKEELAIHSNLTINNANGQLSADQVNINIQNLINSGEITSTQLRLAIAQQLHNYGILQSEIIRANIGEKIVNSNSGIITATKAATIVAPTIDNEGNIEAPELNLIAIYNFNHAATAKIMANLANIVGTNITLSGELTTKVAATLEANKKIIVNTSAKLNGGDKLVITANELINDGFITANNLALNGNTIKNLYNALITSASKLTIDARHLENAGVIESYGQLQLKLLNCLENLQTGKVTSLQHLFIESCSIMKNAGLISSKTTALIKLGNVLENYSTGVMQAKTFSLKGGWSINNWGEISGQDQLQLEIGGIINNYQSGNLSSQQALKLIGNTLDNYGTIQSDQLTLFLSNTVQNHKSGNIAAIEALNFIGAKLIINAGEISSQQNIDFELTKTLENLQTGKITAATGLNAVADLLVANHGQMTANNMKLAAAKLLLDGKINSKSLTGKAKVITSEGELHTGATDLTADLVRTDGSLHASSLIIEAKNYLHLLKNGAISCTEASALLSKAGFINLGKILNEAPLSIIAQELFHDKTASFDARHELYLKAINLYVDGDLKASNNLFLLVANRLEYQSATLKSDGELHLTLANGSQIKHNINTPGDLTIEFLDQTGEWYNEKQLIAGKDLTINVPGHIFVNGHSSKEALLKAQNCLTVDAQSVQLAQGKVQTDEIVVTSKTDINIDPATEITMNAGLLHAKDGGIEQAAPLECSGNLAFVAGDNNPNDSLIYKLADQFFTATPVAQTDQADAFAVIYNIVGSREIGWQARVKAVQQLKENLEQSKIRELIASELKTILLAMAPKDFEALDWPISLKELELIEYIKIIDPLVAATNQAYPYDDPNRQLLVARANQANAALNKIINDQLLNYINCAVAKPGFRLGVTKNTTGIIGALAIINQVNFKILAANDPQNAEASITTVEIIGEQISDPNLAMHYIYLQSDFKLESEQKIACGWHFELLQQTTDPEQAILLKATNRDKRTIKSKAKIKAKTVAMVADGKISISSDIEADADTFIKSLCDDVEIKSIKARRGNHENFDDLIVSQARVAAKNLLQIMAGNNVVLHGVITESGAGGTHLKALGDILDIPVDLVAQRIQHFHEKKKSGTIRDTYYRQHTSVHKSAGEFTSQADNSSTYYAPTIEAQEATIASKDSTSIIFDVTDRHEHHADIKSKKRRCYGGYKKKYSSVSSVRDSSRGAKFKVTKELRISGADIDLHNIDSSAKHNILSASGGKVRFFQGKNQLASISSSVTSDPMWQKSKFESTQETTYSACKFSGTIAIEAKQAEIEMVSGRVLDWLQQIILKPDDTTYTTLKEHYEFQSRSVEGPGPGLIALVALVTTIATQGAASNWAGSLLKTLNIASKTAHVSLAAGFQTLCAQAASTMVANNGDLFKTIKDLNSSSTVKKLATSMLSAGLMHQVGEALDIPVKVTERGFSDHVVHHLVKANIDASLDMAIYNRSAEAAFKDHLISAAFAIVGSGIDVLHQTAEIGKVGHTMLHAMAGAAQGTVNGHGWLIGSIESVIAAKLPGYLAELEQQKELEQSQEQLKIDETEQLKLKQEILLQDKKVELIDKITDKLKLFVALEAQKGNSLNLSEELKEVHIIVDKLEMDQLKCLEKTLATPFSIGTPVFRHASFEKSSLTDQPSLESTLTWWQKFKEDYIKVTTEMDEFENVMYKAQTQEMLKAYETFVVGCGRGAVSSFETAKTLGLIIGEKTGIVEQGTTENYKKKVTKEEKLYDSTEIGKSILGKVADTGTKLYLSCLSARMARIVGSGIYSKYKRTKVLKEGFRGGKYSGEFKKYKKFSTKELRKTISSHQKTISKHKEYIKNPKLKYQNWNDKSKVQKDNAIHHWQEDIKRAQIYKEAAKRILQENMSSTKPIIGSIIASITSISSKEKNITAETKQSEQNSTISEDLSKPENSPNPPTP